LPTFPTDWPEECPPEDIPAAAAVYYRIVRNNPPSLDDFRSYKELGLARRHADPCRRCGLSIFRTFDAAAVARSNFPTLGEFIASGALDLSHGKVAQTGSNRYHCTWWPYESVDRVTPFEIPEIRR
jgi:hypothetical protein